MGSDCQEIGFVRFNLTLDLGNNVPSPYFRRDAVWCEPEPGPQSVELSPCRLLTQLNDFRGIKGIRGYQGR
jgi:hypothetical protein